MNVGDIITIRDRDFYVINWKFEQNKGCTVI